MTVQVQPWLVSATLLRPLILCQVLMAGALEELLWETASLDFLPQLAAAAADESAATTSCDPYDADAHCAPLQVDHDALSLLQMRARKFSPAGQGRADAVAVQREAIRQENEHVLEKVLGLHQETTTSNGLDAAFNISASRASQLVPRLSASAISFLRLTSAAVESVRTRSGGDILIFFLFLLLGTAALVLLLYLIGQPARNQSLQGSSVSNAFPRYVRPSAQQQLMRPSLAAYQQPPSNAGLTLDPSGTSQKLTAPSQYDRYRAAPTPGSNLSLYSERAAQAQVSMAFKPTALPEESRGRSSYVRPIQSSVSMAGTGVNPSMQGVFPPSSNRLPTTPSLQGPPEDAAPKSGRPPALCPQLVLPHCESFFSIPIDRLEAARSSSSINGSYDILGLSGNALLRAVVRTEGGEQIIEVCMGPPKSPPLASIRSSGRASQVEVRTAHGQQYGFLHPTDGSVPGYSLRCGTHEMMAVEGDVQSGQLLFNAPGAPGGELLAQASRCSEGGFFAPSDLEVRVNPGVDSVLVLLTVFAVVIYAAGGQDLWGHSRS